MSEIPETHELSRKEREAAWRKSEIIEAAGRLFVERGYEATSLQEIAEASEFSVGTLYNFFEGKEDIYFAVIESHMADFYNRAQKAMCSTDDPVVKLEQFARAHFEYAIDEKDTLKRFWHEMAGFAWALKERLRARLEKSGYLPLTLLVPVFDQLKAAGFVEDVESREQAIVFGGMCFSYLMMWFRSGEDMDLKSYAPVVVKRFLEGFGRRG